MLGCTKGHLAHLERDGVISRTERNRWPLVKTIRAVLEQAKAQRSAVSEAQAQWQRARARREEMRIAREAHRLCLTSEWEAAWDFALGALKVAFASVPARSHPRDVTARASVQREIDAAFHEACDAAERQSEALHNTGAAVALR